MCTVLWQPANQCTSNMNLHCFAFKTGNHLIDSFCKYRLFIKIFYSPMLFMPSFSDVLLVYIIILTMLNFGVGPTLYIVYYLKETNTTPGRDKSDELLGNWFLADSSLWKLFSQAEWAVAIGVLTIIVKFAAIQAQCILGIARFLHIFWFYFK